MLQLEGPWRSRSPARRAIGRVRIRSDRTVRSNDPEGWPPDPAGDTAGPRKPGPS